MTNRDAAPVGAPCWADLWTSDVAGSRRFYAELFGWEAQAASPEFGGYFMFTREGAPTAGAMGDRGDTRADDTWTAYLATDDIEGALAASADLDARVEGGAMQVADLGAQATIVDPTGARVGLWQPGAFSGFSVIGEPGSPSWFELHTRDFPRALAFYENVFGLEAQVGSDTGDPRYALLRRPGDAEDLAGIMDASILPQGVQSAWYVYWEVEDVERSVATAAALGGKVLSGPDHTPYGILAGLEDPAGAHFRLRKAPSSR